MAEKATPSAQPVPVWFCWVPKLGGDLATGNGGLHRAATAGKARYSCLLNARDAGYDISFADIRVRRERAYDHARFHSNGVMPCYAELPL